MSYKQLAVDMFFVLCAGYSGVFAALMLCISISEQLGWSQPSDGAMTSFQLAAMYAWLVSTFITAMRAFHKANQ